MDTGSSRKMPSSKITAVKAPNPNHISLKGEARITEVEVNKFRDATRSINYRKKAHDYADEAQGKPSPLIAPLGCSQTPFTKISNHRLRIRQRPSDYKKQPYPCDFAVTSESWQVAEPR